MFFTDHSARRRAAPITPLRRKHTGFAAYLDLWRQRRTLSDLSPHQLRDIGLTREAADREAARPLWDAPDHWRR